MLTNKQETLLLYFIVQSFVIPILAMIKTCIYAEVITQLSRQGIKDEKWVKILCAVEKVTVFKQQTFFSANFLQANGLYKGGDII